MRPRRACRTHSPGGGAAHTGRFGLRNRRGEAWHVGPADRLRAADPERLDPLCGTPSAGDGETGQAWRSRRPCRGRPTPPSRRTVFCGCRREAGTEWRSVRLARAEPNDERG
jgi:hypothetical protein